MIYKSEIRPEERNEKAESCQENLWNKIQLKEPERLKQTQEQNKKDCKLVSWCCEPSQPLRITSGLKNGQARLVYVKKTTTTTKNPHKPQRPHHVKASLKRYRPLKTTLGLDTSSLSASVPQIYPFLHRDLLVGALNPVNHKGLHQGRTQTPIYLHVIHFTSHHTTSHVFWAYLYSAGTQHENLPSARWPILFCGPTQEPCVSHSKHRRNWERFWKKIQVNGLEW